MAFLSSLRPPKDKKNACHFLQGIEMNPSPLRDTGDPPTPIPLARCPFPAPRPLLGPGHVVGMWAELTCQATVLCRRGWLLGLCWIGGWCIPGKMLKRRPDHRSLNEPLRLAKSTKNLQVPCGYKALLQAHEARRLEISE